MHIFSKLAIMTMAFVSCAVVAAETEATVAIDVSQVAVVAPKKVTPAQVVAAETVQAPAEANAEVAPCAEEAIAERETPVIPSQDK